MAQISPQNNIATWKKYLFWVCMGILGALGGLWFEYNRPTAPVSSATTAPAEASSSTLQPTQAP